MTLAGLGVVTRGAALGSPPLLPHYLLVMLRAMIRGCTSVAVGILSDNAAIIAHAGMRDAVDMYIMDWSKAPRTVVSISCPGKDRRPGCTCHTSLIHLGHGMSPWSSVMSLTVTATLPE